MHDVRYWRSRLHVPLHHAFPPEIRESFANERISSAPSNQETNPIVESPKVVGKRTAGQSSRRCLRARKKFRNYRSACRYVAGHSSGHGNSINFLQSVYLFALLAAIVVFHLR